MSYKSLNIQTFKLPKIIILINKMLIKVMLYGSVGSVDGRGVNGRELEFNLQ